MLSWKKDHQMDIMEVWHALALPAMGHWSTCPLYFQHFIFLFTLKLHKVWQQRVCNI